MDARNRIRATEAVRNIALPSPVETLRGKANFRQLFMHPCGAIFKIILVRKSNRLYSFQVPHVRIYQLLPCFFPRV